MESESLNVVDLTDVQWERNLTSDFGTRYLEDNLTLVESKALHVQPIEKSLLWDKLFSVFEDDKDFPDWHKIKVLELLTKRMDRAQAILDNR